MADDTLTTSENGDTVQQLADRVMRLETQFDYLLMSTVSKGAAPQEKKPTEKFGLSEHIDKVVKLAGSILAVITGVTFVLYAFGFVIYNTYLSTFGVREFQVVKPTYLSIGVMFLVFISTTILLPVLLLLSTRKSWRYTGFNLRVMELFLLFVIIILFILSTTIFLSFATESDVNIGNYATITVHTIDFLSYSEYLIFGVIILFFAWLITINYDKGKNIILFLYIILVAFVMPLFFIYGVSIYPNVSTALAGGRLINIRMVTSDESKAWQIQNLGIPVNKGVTDTVKLIDEDDKYLLILLNNNNAVKINKTLVSNVLYQRQGLLYQRQGQ